MAPMTKADIYRFITPPFLSWLDGQAKSPCKYEGKARKPEGNSLARYQAVYFSRWPDGPDRLGWPDIAYFVVRPKWIRYSDFNRNPPRIEEFSF